jgi:hypothetical protein
MGSHNLLQLEWDKLNLMCEQLEEKIAKLTNAECEAVTLYFLLHRDYYYYCYVIFMIVIITYCLL